MKKNPFKPVLLIIVAMFAFFLATCMVEPMNMQRYVEKEVDNTEDPPQYDRIIKDENDFDEAMEDMSTSKVKDGEIWLIKKGTYNRQLVITKSITVVGESRDEVIIAGPINYVEGEKKLKGVESSDMFYDLPEVCGLINIYGVDGNGVKIKDLTVCGNYAQNAIFSSVYQAKKPGETHLKFLCGVGVVDSEVTLENLVIKDIRHKDEIGSRPFGYGIFAGGIANVSPKNLTVNGCIISDFQRYGVVVLESIKMLTFTGNTVTGMGKTVCSPDNNRIVNDSASFDSKFSLLSSGWKEFYKSFPVEWPTDWAMTQQAIFLMNNPAAKIERNTFKDFINSSAITSNNTTHEESLGMTCYWYGLDSIPSASTCVIKDNIFSNCEKGIEFDIYINSPLKNIEKDYLNTHYMDNSFIGGPIREDISLNIY
jgi:nitrous oxidase accessory protein NosD